MITIKIKNKEPKVQSKQEMLDFSFC